MRHYYFRKVLLWSSNSVPELLGERKGLRPCKITHWMNVLCPIVTSLNLPESISKNVAAVYSITASQDWEICLLSIVWGTEVKVSRLFLRGTKKWLVSVYSTSPHVLHLVYVSQWVRAGGGKTAIPMKCPCMKGDVWPEWGRSMLKSEKQFHLFIFLDSLTKTRCSHN